MSVDVVPGDVTVKPSSNDVGKAAYQVDIRCLVENEAFFGRESFAGKHSIDDLHHSRIARSRECRGAGRWFEMEHAHWSHSVDPPGLTDLFLSLPTGCSEFSKNAPYRSSAGGSGGGA